MKSVLKKLLIVCIFIALFTWAALVGAKYYIIPGAIKSGAMEKSQEFWTGDLSIGEVSFHFFKPIFISEIVLTDSAGTERVRCEAVLISLGKWHRLKPAITELDIAKLYMRPEIGPASFVLPGLTLPEPDPKEQDEKDFEPPLQAIEIRDCTIEFDHHDETFLFPGNSLSFGQEKGTLNLIFSSSHEEDYLHLTGEIHPQKDGPADSTFRLTIDRMIEPELAELFFTLAGKAMEYDGRGMLNGHAEITGDLRDWRGMTIDGDFQLSGAELAVRGYQVLREFDAHIELEADQVEIDQFKGLLCSGTLDGSARAGLKRLAPDYYNLEYEIKDADLTALGQAFTAFQFLKGGKGTMAFGVEGYAGSTQTLQGEGSAVISDADIRTFPVLSAVLSVMQLNSLDPVKISDLAAHFTMEGSVLRFDKASVSNAVSAIDMQENGTFDIQSGQVDCYVVGMPLHKVESGLANIPVINLFTQLKDTLVRLKVKGHYQDPPTKLVRKEPITDLGKGTLEFFQGVAKTGGDLPGQIINSIFSPFQSDEKTEEKKPAQTEQTG